MFEGRDDICVPPVLAGQTTERVLTMHFEQVRSVAVRSLVLWHAVSRDQSLRPGLADEGASWPSGDGGSPGSLERSSRPSHRAND